MRGDGSFKAVQIWPSELSASIAPVTAALIAVRHCFFSSLQVSALHQVSTLGYLSFIMILQAEFKIWPDGIRLDVVDCVPDCVDAHHCAAGCRQQQHAVILRAQGSAIAKRKSWSHMRRAAWSVGELMGSLMGKYADCWGHCLCCCCCRVQPSARARISTRE